MDKRNLYKKLMRLDFIHTKNPVVLISIIGLLVFLFLIPFLFILKVFLILASIALGLKLWDKRHTFFQKKSAAVEKRQLSVRTQHRGKTQHRS